MVVDDDAGVPPQKRRRITDGLHDSDDEDTDWKPESGLSMEVDDSDDMSEDPTVNPNAMRAYSEEAGGQTIEGEPVHFATLARIKHSNFVPAKNDALFLHDHKSDITKPKNKVQRENRLYFLVHLFCVPSTSSFCVQWLLGLRSNCRS